MSDTANLAHLRCGAELDLIAIAADLDRDLGAVTDFEDRNPTLRCGENAAPVRQADALALVRTAEYELVCVAPSRARRRNDRDRRPPLDAGWR